MVSQYICSCSKFKLGENKKSKNKPKNRPVGLDNKNNNYKQFQERIGKHSAINKLDCAIETSTNISNKKYKYRISNTH